MMIKGIVFDKDGVLVDFDRTWVTMLIDMAAEWSGGDAVKNERLLTSAGYDDATNSFFAGSVWAAGNTDDLVEVWDETGTAAGREELVAFINQRCVDCEIIPMFPKPELQGLFKGLVDDGLKLGLTTNDGEVSAKLTMDDFGLTPYLSLIVGYDSVENPKPAADPVLAFCQTCDLSPEQMLVIGDNAHDLEMGEAAGVAIKVGVLSGNSNRQELQPMADYLLDSVMDLPQLLQSKNLIEKN